LKASHIPEQMPKAMHNEFTAIIESAPAGGSFADCSEITGANGQGKTIEECRQNLAEAIALILADRREEGLRGVPEDAIRQVVSISS
jgi:predicted RNase H-like HicB family nuclease